MIVHGDISRASLPETAAYSSRNTVTTPGYLIRSAGGGRPDPFDFDQAADFGAAPFGNHDFIWSFTSRGESESSDRWSTVKPAQALGNLARLRHLNGCRNSL
jgi:hypothetical protein